MKAIQVFLKDMKILVSKPMLLLSFLGVAVLPMLYSGFLVQGSWDPYGNTDKLPIAVVNLDKGASYEGKTMQIGADFIDELQTNDEFKWSFVDQGNASEGMANNKYYMTITLPENFSENATTLTQEHPVQAEVIYETNTSYNFVAGQIGNTAMKELKSKLSVQITEAYTRSMFEQIDTISEGLGTAGDGANELKDGASELKDGLTTLKTNVNKLSTSTSELKNGIGIVYSGADSLHQGTDTLTTGVADLSSGLGELAAAEKQLEDGAIKSQSGASELEDGLKSSQQGSSQLKDGLSSSVTASGQLANGAQQVAKGLEQMLAATPELEDNEQFKQLLAASKQVAQGSDQLHEGQQQLLAGSKELDQGQQQLYAGAKQLNEGQKQLVDGMTTFGTKLNEASTGSQKLTAGATELKDGAASLEDGLNKLNGGAADLADGSQQLDNGAGELKDGSEKLVDGSGELADKLNDAATESSDVNSGDDTIDMFAEPVKLTENTDNKLSNYGLGIAPYFLSLALFMGALVFTTVFSLRDSNVPGATPMGRFVSRTLTFTIIGLIQSILADVVLLYVLKIEVQSVSLFFLFTMLSSLTFIWIIQALVTWLDNPGRFAAIILMIFQLTSSAGTFPLEMLPDWMQKISPWLPMTYTIVGFKTIIGTGDYALLREQILYLVIYAVIFLVLTFGYFLRQHRKQSAKPKVLTV